jgi:acetyl esterase/lipase
MADPNLPRLRCHECGNTFSPDAFDADAARVRCPDCGAAVSNRVDEDGDDRPRRRRVTRGGSSMKWVIGIGAVLGVLGLGCCGVIVGLVWYTIKPTDFGEQTQEYTEARKAFKTSLTHKGRAPQIFEPVKPPPGVTEINYLSGELELRAWIDQPRVALRTKPAVLFLHGGYAFAMDDWDQCKPFRNAGFVTMTPMLRGENGLPGSFSLFYDEVDDVLAAAEVLAKTPGIDPKRVYVAGHSAGGTLAMLAAMTSKRFRACASFSGSPDQVAFLRQQPLDMVPFDPNNRKELMMRSPLAFPRSFQCPARLYFGDEEFVFEFSTKALAEKAQAAGKDVQSVEVPGDHMTSVDSAIGQAILFFEQK